MPVEHRSAQVSKGLSFVFTMWTWVTIGPAVGIGLLLSAVFAMRRLDLIFDDILPIIIFGGVAMLVMGFLGTLFWRAQFRKRLLYPLRDLGSVMLEAGSGDLMIRSDIVSEDEIGLLANECNALISSLSGIAREVRESAESVSGAATQLSASSEEINSSTMEISQSVQQIAHGAELQSRKVEETSAAMEAISSNVTGVAEQAEEASRTSEEAARFALEGEEATAEAIDKIVEVQQAIETLAGSIEILGKRSVEIGNIVDVITSIAEQTNLLSLNAAIEAARAGESGRGFSVVADEVRKLADGSGKAAERIGELIKEVQEETSKAIQYMEVGTREVALGTQVVTKSGDALRNITDSVSRTAMLSEQIAHATAEQGSRTAVVDRAMHDIAAVVEQNAAATEQTAAAAQEQTACMEEISASSQELADMAVRLEESVQVFRIK